MSTSNSLTSNVHAPQRRDFLRLALVTGGALAAGSVVSGAQASELKREPAPPEPQQQGYHVTPHITDYYATARL